MGWMVIAVCLRPWSFDIDQIADRHLIPMLEKIALQICYWQTDGRPQCKSEKMKAKKLQHGSFTHNETTDRFTSSKTSAVFSDENGLCLHASDGRFAWFT